MKTLIKKEIRLILPAWIVAMLLTLIPMGLSIAWSTAWIGRVSRNLPYFVHTVDVNSPLPFITPFIFIFVGVLFLGINSFGQEMSSGTFAALLSQPMERRRVWLVKITTLAVAFVLVWLVAIVLIFWQFEILAGLEVSWYGWIKSLKSMALECLTLSVFVTFSGGLWTTLLLRQTTGAFWFSLLTPLAIVLGISSALDNWMAAGHSINTIVVLALVCYSIVGFFYAQRLFFRAQDLQWSGGEISFPWRKKISEIKTASLPTRPRSWLFALVWKEIQLHQSSFIIAVLVLALHLVSFFIRKFHVHIENPDLQFVLQVIWILWLLMPLLIGATAIAEERRMGTAEAQLCLPVSRHAQLFLKFFVALLLSLFFGGFIPWLVEGVGTVTNWIFPIVAAIFFVSFYASSLARTTLQAIGLTILFVVLIYFYEAAIGTFSIIQPRFYSRNPLFGLILLKRYISAFILLGVLGYLTSWNFKRQHQNRRLWLRNIIAILVAWASILILVNAAYFRAWEILLPSKWELLLSTEPAHGPARLNSSSEIKFSMDAHTLYAALPNGKLWSKKLPYYSLTNWCGNPAFITRQVEVTTNGELWFFRKFQPPIRYNLGPQEFHLGQNAKWKAAVGSLDSILAIRSDGTLWNFPYSGRFNEGPRSPRQLGNQSDWISLIGGDPEKAFALAADGSIWDCDPRVTFEWLAPSRKLIYIGNIFQATENNSHENPH